jgi:hypothetical protein
LDPSGLQDTTTAENNFKNLSFGNGNLAKRGVFFSYGYKIEKTKSEHIVFLQIAKMVEKTGDTEKVVYPESKTFSPEYFKQYATPDGWFLDHAQGEVTPYYGIGFDKKAKDSR